MTILEERLAATLEVSAIDDSSRQGSDTFVLILDASESYLLLGRPAGGDSSTIASDDAPGDLVVSSLTPPAVGGAGVSMVVAYVTGNQGAGAAEPSSTGLYPRESVVHGSAAVLLGTRAAPSRRAGADTASTSVIVPAGTATGLYCVIARADVNGAVLESQETNNTRSARFGSAPTSEWRR